jgi:hypothetical protein
VASEHNSKDAHECGDAPSLRHGPPRFPSQSGERWAEGLGAPVSYSDLKSNACPRTPTSVRPLAQLRDEPEPVQPGHHHVADDQVWPDRADDRERRLAAGRLDNVAERREPAAHHRISSARQAADSDSQRLDVPPHVRVVVHCAAPSAWASISPEIGPTEQDAVALDKEERARVEAGV